MSRPVPNWPSNAFLDIEPRLAEFGRARFVILPVAYDVTASYRKGCRFGPDAIIAASPQLELFDEQFGAEFHRAGIHVHGHLVDPEDQPAPPVLQNLLYDVARPLYRAGKTVIALGGEHAISVGLIRAAREQWRDLSVLHFDAHADLRDEYEDSPLSHACVMRRVHDLGVPFVSVGVRSYDRAQHEFIRARDIRLITPQQVRGDRERAIVEILDRLGPRVYVTFDIDALDPGQAPGTGTPEPGGLDYLDVIEILAAVGRRRQIVAGDLVETMPLAHTHVTEFTAARLVYKLIAACQLTDRDT